MPVLVADDHPTNRAVIGHQLQRLGYPHIVVEDGEQAWQALCRDRYGLLLTDCHMPVLDGYALAGRIRQAEARAGNGAHLPILALTASRARRRAPTQPDPMDGYLDKPTRLEDLQSALLRHLGPRCPEGPAQTASPEPPLPLHAFGAPEHVLRLLEDLLHTARDDLLALDRALRTGDRARQRDLLHRLEGALRLFGQDDDSAASGDPGRRRDALVRRLDALARLLRDCAPHAGNGGA